CSCFGLNAWGENHLWTSNRKVVSVSGLAEPRTSATSRIWESPRPVAGGCQSTITIKVCFNMPDPLVCWTILLSKPKSATSIKDRLGEYEAEISIVFLPSKR
ncbi:MAG: hypothetical protein WBM86_19580, partial [Waterburya sp.]